MAATQMRVYRNGVPAHAQVFVDPEHQAVVDFVEPTEDGDIVWSTAVYDTVSLEAIAEQRECEIVEVDLADAPVIVPSEEEQEVAAAAVAAAIEAMGAAEAVEEE